MGLIRAFLEADYEVYAIAPKDDYTSYLKDIGCKVESLEIDNTGSNPIRDLKLAFTYYDIYKRISPDIILHYTIKPNIYGTLAANRLSIPVINNVSGLGTVFLNKGMVSKVAKTLYQYSFKKADLVFFQNRDDKEEFLNHINIPSGKTEILPGSGINLSEYVPLKRAENTTFRFLMIARIIKDKGVHEYVEAAKLLKAKGENITFQLLGEIDENHKRGIKRKVVASWDSKSIIEYLGSSNNVSEVIKESDCIVLPSYREGTPRTLLEGAAMAKPLIATNVPGCKDVVIDGVNGYTCDAKSASDLADAMLKLYNDGKEKNTKFGQASRSLVEEKFDEQIVIESYFKRIFELTNRQRVSGSACTKTPQN